MPYKLRKTNGYGVKGPSGWKSKGTTKKKAKKQIRLLRGIEHSDWKPTKRRKKRKKK